MKVSKLKRLGMFFNRWRFESKTARIKSRRNKDIIKLRRKGLTYRAIGEKYGISAQRVFEIIKNNKE